MGPSSTHLLSKDARKDRYYVSEVTGPLSGDVDVIMEDMPWPDTIDFYVVEKNGKYFQQDSDTVKFITL